MKLNKPNDKKTSAMLETIWLISLILGASTLVIYMAYKAGTVMG